jgi:hypothetical protein
MNWLSIDDLHSLLLINREFDYLDPFFLREFLGMINHFGPTTIVETGTYKGGMIKFLSKAKPELPIFSCDVNNVNSVIEHFKFNDKIYIEQCKSKVLLRKLEGQLGIFPFFFLDAHSTMEVGQDTADTDPLAEELSIVIDLYPNSIICIHDFEVPGLPIFGHGCGDIVTGKTIAVNWGVIEKVLVDSKIKYSAWFPHFPPRSLTVEGIRWNKLFDLRGRIYIMLNPTKATLRDMLVLEDFGILWKYKENK